MDQEYLKKFYPFQDEVLQSMRKVQHEFYLTGGTAASRIYLHHRYSEDLDFFANDHPDFLLWAERVIAQLAQDSRWSCHILLKESRFVRLFLKKEGLDLKLEFVNDVPSHVGEIKLHEKFGRVDSAENIFANKITAVIDRRAPKDYADIWGFYGQMKLSVQEAIQGAQSKAAGIFPPDLARALFEANEADWRAVQWIQKPDAKKFIQDLHQLAESLLLPA